MENVVEVKASSVPVREIGVITAEIKDLCRQAQTMALLFAVEIGRRLEEAKRALPYGAWGEWLKMEVEFSQSTANNFMRLFEEYGSSQISIFGASVDSQTFANLPYSKALQLLAVPKEERESFAKEVGAEDLSVKELKAAIAERDRARREADEAVARENAIADRLAEAEAAEAEAKEKAEEAETLRRKLDDMKQSLEETKKKADDLREKLKKAKSDPKIPPEKLNEIRKQAAEAAQKEIEAQNGALLAEAQKKAESAEAEALAAKVAEKQALERLEDARKQLKTANPKVTAFKTLFDTLQETAAKLQKKIAEIREEDSSTADKLSAALRAFGERL